MTIIHPLIVTEKNLSPAIHRFCQMVAELIIKKEDSMLKYYHGLANLSGSYTLSLPQHVDYRPIMAYSSMYLEPQATGFDFSMSFSCNAFYTSKTIMGVKAGLCKYCPYDDIGFLSGDSKSPTVCEIKKLVTYATSTDRPKEEQREASALYQEKVEREKGIDEEFYAVVVEFRKFFYSFKEGSIDIKKLSSLGIEYGTGLLVPNKEGLAFFRSSIGGWNSYKNYGWVKEEDAVVLKEEMGDNIQLSPKNFNIGAKKC